MAKSPVATPAAAQGPVSAADAIDTTGWVEQQLGFAPYFNPTPGAKFVATPIEIDDKDPDFVRYVFIAEHAMECQQGPKEDAEPVLVEAGGQFTMAAYASLSMVFEDYLGLKCRVTVKDKIKIADNKTLWRFTLAVSQEDNARLMAQKQANSKARAIKAREKAAELKAKNSDANSSAAVNG